MNAYSVTHSLVDSTESVLGLLEIIQTLPSDVPSLFLDLEGHVYLVDVHALQSSAFSTTTGDGTTLKTILESPTIIKVFFDVRNDSDALFHHFAVNLRGVEDVQLMENAARPGRRCFVMGLEKCIDTYAQLSPSEKLRWKAVKEAGLKLCHPKKGGSYEVFNDRPIQALIETYCINDVQHLPQLREKFWRSLNNAWREEVRVETRKRVWESQSKSYEPQSEKKKFGPWESGPTMVF
ncbi:3 -5 exonuclease [Colletotrichum incanum]|uniref:3-5 exonuclease n=1 Tax=Colletotrichum incanum TaxID=1573173 RepID=A0A162PKB1_COLIC|nr:3 -5 exonuclease [Colletotrichum incanum]